MGAWVGGWVVKGGFVGFGQLRAGGSRAGGCRQGPAGRGLQAGGCRQRPAGSGLHSGAAPLGRQVAASAAFAVFLWWARGSPPTWMVATRTWARCSGKAGGLKGRASSWPGCTSCAAAGRGRAAQWLPPASATTAPEPPGTQAACAAAASPLHLHSTRQSALQTSRATPRGTWRACPVPLAAPRCGGAR